ncbi:Transcriptional regulatory protein sin3, partial [Elasticomyces elasticus]
MTQIMGDQSTNSGAQWDDLEPELSAYLDRPKSNAPLLSDHVADSDYDDADSLSFQRAKPSHTQKQSVHPDAPPVSPTLIPALPSPMSPTTTTAATAEEIGFFDRAKKFIGNKVTFNDFLKLCNLYAQEIISLTQLIYRARSFIGGNPELMKYLEVFVGYEDEKMFIENRPRAATGRVSLSNCRGLGPSYRLLPKRAAHEKAQAADPPPVDPAAKERAARAADLKALEITKLKALMPCNIKFPVSDVRSAPTPGGLDAMLASAGPEDEKKTPEKKPTHCDCENRKKRKFEEEITTGSKLRFYPQNKRARTKKHTFGERVMSRFAISDDRPGYYCTKNVLEALENEPELIQADQTLLHHEQERQKVCSGRDELCHEVLNDHWASHPTWASEDSGFIAHRKNLHEEALHRIEEERHDYDHNIEGLIKTIQLLEPFGQQMLRMPEDERAAFVLPPNLGGQGETVHKRTIMRIYGRETGKDVMDELCRAPWNVLPVLLNRLKFTLESWKNAQREWEKIWRDQTQKLFWKSLDHQSFSAKNSDKRQFQTKNLQNELLTKLEEQKRSRILNAGGVKYQLDFAVVDDEVVVDASYLLLIQAEHMEVAKLVTFVKELIPLFFGIDVEWFNARIKEKYGSTPANEEADETTSATEDVSSKSRKTNGKKPDLLRTALDRGRSGKPSRKEKEDGVASDSRASTPGVASAVGEDADRAPVTPDEETQPGPTVKRWMEYADTENMYRGKSVSAKQPYKRNLYNLYGNLPIYCFFRMFIILYERLSQIKLAEGDVREAVRRANMPKPAIDLQINDKLPRNFWDDTSPDANYYHQILKMLAEFTRGEMDFSHIEETLRRYYLHTGWRLYSYERLSQALVRFATAMLGTEAKDKSWELLQLFRKDRVREETTYHDEIVYRKQADKYLKEADTYKISY